MPAPKTVRVFAPATVANVSCGYDILGFAVAAPGDELIASLNTSGKVSIRAVHGSDRLPQSADKNSAAVATQALLEYLKNNKIIASEIGVELELFKKMPLGSGLGSSAASSAAGVYALNQLLDKPLPTAELVQFATQGEKIACGTAHADNVAPALLGGFVLIRSYSPLDIVNLPTSCKLFAAILHPHLEVKTEDARKILKKTIALDLAIRQWGNVAGLVAGLTLGNIQLIGRSLEDLVIEPERALLIPGFNQIKSAALSAGALGCSISGSGPSMFALSEDLTKAQKIAESMQAALTGLNINSELYVSAINTRGCQVLGTT